MQKCIRNKNGGMQSRRLFVRSFFLIVSASPILLLVVMVSEILIGVLQTVVLIVWQYAVNTVEDFLGFQSSYGRVLMSFALSMTAYIAMDVFRLMVESFHTLFNSSLSECLQSRLYEKCRAVSAIYFEDSKLYDEIDRAVDSIEGIISLAGIFAIFMMAASRVITLVTYVSRLKPMLAVIIVLPIVPIFVARFIRGADIYKLNFKQSEKRRECDYYMSCILRKETKTLQAVNWFIEKWRKVYGEIEREERKVNRKLCWVFLFLNLLKYTVYIVGVGLAVLYLFEGAIDVGMFALIIGMMGTSHATMEVVVEKGSDIPGSLRYAKDYFAFLDKPNDISDQKICFGHSIELKHVSFAYPNSSQPVLQDINLRIKRGEKIALVGINGSGKTTLAKIILGILNPDEGEILLDGKQRSENTLIDGSIVFQDFCRYFFTLQENVAFGDIGRLYEERELIQCLEAVYFFETQPGLSLDTQLGRDYAGAELSKGEWQKIALARGFFKKFNLIILDEPNSSLDPLAENKMFRRFVELLEEHTGIIITHRMGIGMIADRIIVLDHGRIVEEGTHEALMEEEGMYRQMFMIQADLYK